MRARVFLAGTDRWTFGCELEATDADDVWRRLEADPSPASRRLAQGDIVYIADVYLQLDGDGGWQPITPSRLTRELYLLAQDG